MLKHIEAETESRLFAENISKSIFVVDNACIFISISLKCFSQCTVNNTWWHESEVFQCLFSIYEALCNEKNVYFHWHQESWYLQAPEEYSGLSTSGATITKSIHCPRFKSGLQGKSLMRLNMLPQITKFMGPTWSPPGSCQPQMGPMLAPCTLLSGAAVAGIFLKY